MVDTTTPKLGLDKPEVGASADSWGDKINGNMDVLDNALLGTGPIVVQGSGDFRAPESGDFGVRYRVNAAYGSIGFQYTNADGSVSIGWEYAYKNARGRFQKDTYGDLRQEDDTGALQLVGYRGIPPKPGRNAGALVVGDAGHQFGFTGGLAVPTNANAPFAAGDVVLVFNDGNTAQTITGAQGVSLRLAGSTATGPRTVGVGGIATLFYRGGDLWYVSGPGVS